MMTTISAIFCMQLRNEIENDIFNEIFNAPYAYVIS